MKEKILTTIILIMFCTLAFCQCVKAETEVKTTIQIKYNTKRWEQINISEAYDKCQELNEKGGALGNIDSDNVMAHLSTNADWYALSLLTWSSYGSRKSGNTTDNASGIMNLSDRTFTAGIMEGYKDSDNYRSLITNIDSKFVEIIKPKDNQENNKPGLGLFDYEILNGALLELTNDVSRPISCRSGLFELGVGSGNSYKFACTGEPSLASFRPVIWVK